MKMSFPNQFRTMNPYEMHKVLINTYILKKPGDTNLLKRNASKDKRDIDVIKQNHKFLWNEETPASWEERLAKKYYDKLFKEYCICDLKLYKENKVALRWRTQAEVVSGKGQFECGSKLCTNSEGLKTWEVNFAYREDNQKKNALVKLRLCPPCSDKLNYRTKRREVKRIKTRPGKLKKHKEKDEAEGKKKDEAEGNEKSSENSREAPAESTSTETETTLWSQSQTTADKTRDEEFEEYLEELLF